MAISSFMKAAAKVGKGMKKPTPKKGKVENPKPKTFESELENIRGMALKDETRNNKLLNLYKKYGKKAPAKLIKPVKRKKGGKIGKAPHNRLY